jgi:hypothetical protein
LPLLLASWQELAEGHDPVVVVGFQKLAKLHMCSLF